MYLYVSLCNEQFAFDPVYCILHGTLVDRVLNGAKICPTGKVYDIDFDRS